MSTIKKTINDLAMTRDAKFRANAGATITLHDDGSKYPIRVEVDAQWFSSSELREAAKLFKKLAKQIEAEGRAA
ncbi:hypothetical protein [Burkholderia oklahomensis]|uniref:Uncharacterized protein n=1 Tax=Burkholderia oklahomensis TaxID=342113 RepID=A0AAI8FS68_9BURK|nr:hypothetical protein [Burkholderia oklahomensis]AIO70745.1 hypothetical protein DM82_4334 [Burkholderia oklahomensis]AOI40121.1 hypothetical protein WG70_11195 [Burkholderia oklahomensis EO147]KUY68321.1 hypothetical protein WG70_24965 [Burkholderia oklahomensis EO147]QPS39509.1 hypothetical protein I6G57_27100 [Burkholderia oklahomensis]